MSCVACAAYVTTLHTLETLVMCPVLHVSQLYTPALGVGVSLCVVVCRTVGTIRSQRADVLLRAIQIQPGYSLLSAIHTVLLPLTVLPSGTICADQESEDQWDEIFRISSPHHALSVSVCQESHEMIESNFKEHDCLY